ncbi:MAG TPA: DUF1338 family protein [Phycisphaerales bacterium]|nr:DUF1338 family protein [Phycisphaerales bacterium]
MAPTDFAGKIDMQNRLFAELSRMFGKEVPLYDKALAVNAVTNRAVCDLLAQMHRGFAITDAQLDKTSGERHGAIRIGRRDEYRWIARFFGCFAMEPHNYYDMSSVGAKSQPIIATAFRSVVNPEHRVFTSLLQTDYFDAQTQARIENLLAGRQVFSDAAKALIEKSEHDGGLSWHDADQLIAQGTSRIFKWTGKARDHQLYKDLCDGGFKIAADIACFESHHLNHLTPNTLCMDLYTAAMKMCMGEIAPPEFRRRALAALDLLSRTADRDYLRLSFKHFKPEEIDAFTTQPVSREHVETLTDALTNRLRREDLDLTRLKHSGFKDFTEGPSEDTPVLLRQDAYKALTEPVEFTNPDGAKVQTVHTARFGEIEQRFYATTPRGRELYDRCLAIADAGREKDPSIAKRDYPAYQAAYRAAFAPFPKTLGELIDADLVYARYSATPKGLAARGSISTTSLAQLVNDGHARREGLRYEDFLPVSAAGIFASNLNQYGTKSTAAERPKYTQAMLEEIMGKKIVDADAAYRGMHALSILNTYRDLGLLDKLNTSARASLEMDAAKAPAAAR